jgi:hypothetical protein
VSIKGEYMAKILPINKIEHLDVPVEDVLSIIPSLDTVIIAGWTKDGDEYFASSVDSGGTILWLIERMRKRLLEIAEEQEIA